MGCPETTKAGVHQVGVERLAKDARAGARVSKSARVRLMGARIYNTQSNSAGVFLPSCADHGN